MGKIGSVFRGMRHPRVFFVAFGSYVFCMWASNWMIGNVGTEIPGGPHVIGVGFGLSAPSGVVTIGIALALRDLLQFSSSTADSPWRDRTSIISTGIAIALGAAVSATTADSALVVASTSAIVLGEVSDWMGFTSTSPRSGSRVRGWAVAVGVGGLLGAVVDSVVFLSLAFGSLQLLPGQVIGKLLGVFVAVVLVSARRMIWNTTPNPC